MHNAKLNFVGRGLAPAVKRDAQVGVLKPLCRVRRPREPPNLLKSGLGNPYPRRTVFWGFSCALVPYEICHFVTPYVCFANEKKKRATAEAIAFSFVFLIEIICYRRGHRLRSHLLWRRQWLSCHLLCRR